MTDPELLALYRAILTQPGEDTPRLAFADRLDELAGCETDRARFIRTGIEIARIEGTRGWVPTMEEIHKQPVELTQHLYAIHNAERDNKLHALRRAERQLLEGNNCRNAVEWFGVPPITLIDTSHSKPRLRFGPKGYDRLYIWAEPRRGFLDELHCSTDAFLGWVDAFLWNAGQSEFLPLPLIVRQQYACKVCGNVPDDDGTIEHGRGCYVVGSDGGGTTQVEELERVALRKFPPLTSQPITRVVLADAPHIEYDARDSGWNWCHIFVHNDTYQIRGRGHAKSFTVPPGKDTITAVLEHEWPGVTFTYPTQPKPGA